MKTSNGPPERRLVEFAALVRERARQRGRKALLGPHEIQALATRVAILDLAAEEMGLYRAGRETDEGGLTAPEEKLLAESGPTPGALPPGTSDPLALHLAGMARLRADSMSVEEAARLLGVDPSRIRQRLGGRPRTLLGMKVGRAWRVFRYQLEGDGLVPGLEQVVARLPRDDSPVGIHAWLTHPDADLEVNGKPVSPLDWLRTGHDPAPVAGMAGLLGVGM